MGRWPQHSNELVGTVHEQLQVHKATMLDGTGFRRSTCHEDMRSSVGFEHFLWVKEE